MTTRSHAGAHLEGSVAAGRVKSALANTVGHSHLAGREQRPDARRVVGAAALAQ